MVTRNERRLIWFLLRTGLWVDSVQMRTARAYPKWGTRWLYRVIRERQVVDNHHHAPCCPANHWCRMQLVYHTCTCGAAYYADQDAQRMQIERLAFGQSVRV